jgi:hypothetical protein
MYSAVWKRNGKHHINIGITIYRSIGRIFSIQIISKIMTYDLDLDGSIPLHFNCQSCVVNKNLIVLRCP